MERTSVRMEGVRVRVLGIDPGLATMGYGVVDRISGTIVPVALGVIRTPGDRSTAARLASIGDDLDDLIEAHGPDVVAVERLFFNRNVRTAMSVGQASGVALATAARHGLEVFSYTPPEVKLSVVGTGGASKQQVQTMVARLLGLAQVPRFPDAADACALAICHINCSGLKAAIGAAT